MKEFRVKSIKVPDGVEVSLFKEENFNNEELTADQGIDCLTTPFNLNFL
jgi:hypothetical protein